MMEPRSVAIVGDLAVVGAAAVAGAAVLMGARRAAHRERRTWHLLGLSLLAWASGSALSFGSHLADRTAVPTFGDHGSATSAYLVTTILYIAAVVLHPGLSPHLVRMRGVANSLIVAASLTTVLWFAAGRHLYEATADAAVAIVAMAYPAADIALVYLALMTARRLRFTDGANLATARPAAYLVAGAFTAIMAGDLVDLVAGAHGPALAVPLLTETLWIAGFALIAMAGRVATRRSPTSAAEADPGDDHRLVGFLGLAPVAAAVFAAAAAAVDWATRHTVDPPGLLMVATVTSMVLARQSVTVGDNRQLGASLQRAVEELERQATHDALTGLPNRSGLGERVARSLEGRHRSSTCAALLFVDLDHLKPVNDSLGHAAGDMLLCATATRLTARVGPAVTRFGGDEFVVLLEDLPAVDAVASAELISRKIVEDTSRPIEVAGHVIRPSVSVGVAIAEPGVDAGELMRRADLALYRAKAMGRRRVATYDPDGTTDARQRIDLEHELRRAIRNDEFEVHYQPVVDLATGRVEGVESLLRWRHPSRGLLAPDAFLDAASSNGLLGTIGERTLLRVCADLAQVTPLDGGPPLTVAVNLSTTELTDPRVVARVRSALQTFGMDPSRLVVEITEDVVVDDTIRNTIDELCALGVQLAIDDFGTGNSSLRQLGSYPAAILKVDRSFIAQLGEDRRAAAIVGAILGLARTLGMRTVAEGVETPAQARSVAALGCDLAQGWLFARAMPVEDLLAHLCGSFDEGSARTVAAVPPGPSRRSGAVQPPSRPSVEPASAMMRPRSSATGGRSPIAPTT